LDKYRTLAADVSLAGPTNFGPIIRQAMALCRASGNAFTVLLLLADGQVTRSVDTPDGELSPAERETVGALVEASKTSALAVVMVGVGDGPWDAMRAFDDALPQRAFDNWQFVEFAQVVRSCSGAQSGHYDADLALACLQEMPQTFKEVKRLGILGSTQRQPPMTSSAPPIDPPIPSERRPTSASPSASTVSQAEECAICMSSPRNSVLVPCGHAVLCFTCAAALMAPGGPKKCPICRSTPQSHFQLFT
jgi:E3 ubiquitin-protein ligase RGLG